MTQEEKQLLLVDICSRLPYGVKVTWDGKHSLTVTPHIYCAIASEDNINNLPKLLLRPMSDMTKEEGKELEHLSEEYFGKAIDKQIQESLSSSNKNESRILEYIASSVIIDWLNAHHFDYRELIGRGLAIAVTPENNPYKG